MESSDDHRNADFPAATIRNGMVEARLYLPDPERGYYRGSRFDWSGVIGELTCGGHRYVEQWFPAHDPRLHEAVSGPVDAFLPIGFEGVGPGDHFLAIGIGILQRTGDEAYQFSVPYPIVDSGVWRTTVSENSVEFVHSIRDDSDWGYEYSKTVTLLPGEASMRIDHSLRNTGPGVLSTRVFNHNFFTLDQSPTGPALSVTFPFEPRLTGPTRGFGELARLEGRQLCYHRELEPGEIVAGEIQGFGASAEDNRFVLANGETGALVRMTGDRPIAKLYFWSIRTTVCPEPYLDVHVLPGSELDWTLIYEFAPPNSELSS